MGFLRTGVQKIARSVAMGAIAVYARMTNSNRNRVQMLSRAHIGGVWLSHDEALRLSAVWACVCVVSKAIASSTWDIFKEDQSTGNREYQPGSRAYSIFNIRPNPEMTPIGFHEAMLVVALLWGNAYAEIERDIVGRPLYLWPLDPERCSLERGFKDQYGMFSYDMSGKLYLRVLNYDKPDSFLDYVDVYHIHGTGIDGLCGLDLVSLAARTFLQALASERFSLKFYEHGTSMGGVLSTDKDIDQNDIDLIKQNVKDRVAGVENAFEFLVLGGGMKWEALTPTMDDSKHVENWYRLIEETCRWFGVPPHKIAHLLRATFSNIEHEGIEFQRDGLRPWAKRCEQEADYKILPVGPLQIAVNLEWTAEGDAKSKAEVDAILVSNGLRNRNELRRKRGENTIGPLGELFTVQSAMTTLDKIAAAPAPNQPGTGEDPKEPANPNDPPMKKAARALLVSAFNRILKRQTHRAGAFANVKTKKEFIEKFESGVRSHAQYVDEQMRDVRNVLAEFGVTLAVNLDSRIAEEREMLIRAYEMRNLANWCPADRAEMLADEVLQGV